MSGNEENAASEDQERSLTVERDFHAPLATVYEAWSRPEILRQWWRPPDCTVYRCDMDFRIGGVWRIGLETAEGERREVHGVFEEIRPEEYLAFTWQWDFEGARGDQTRVGVTFTALDATTTRITLTHKRFETASDCEGHKTGWAACFDGLAEYIKRSNSSGRSAGEE